jgi:hypothetical protein
MREWDYSVHFLKFGDVCIKPSEVGAHQYEQFVKRTNVRFAEVRSNARNPFLLPALAVYRHALPAGNACDQTRLCLALPAAS